MIFDRSEGELRFSYEASDCSSYEFKFELSGDAFEQLEYLYSSGGGVIAVHDELIRRIHRAVAVFAETFLTLSDFDRVKIYLGVEAENEFELHFLQKFDTAITRLSLDLMNDFDDALDTNGIVSWSCEEQQLLDYCEVPDTIPSLCDIMEGVALQAGTKDDDDADADDEGADDDDDDEYSDNDDEDDEVVP
jgi:hypothetical protein